MVHFIEKGFQVYIYYILKSVVDVAMCFLYCLMQTFVWPKSVAKLRKLELKLCHDHLQYRLLEQPIGYRRDTQ